MTKWQVFSNNPAWGGTRGDPGYSGKLYLERIRLNRGGYTSRGQYFGVGQPLYRVTDEEGSIDHHIRARDRADAKTVVREMYPNAKFFS